MLQCMLYPDSPSQSPALPPHAAPLGAKSPDAALQREHVGVGAAAALQGGSCIADDEHHHGYGANCESHVQVYDDDGDAFVDDALLLAFKVRACR